MKTIFLSRCTDEFKELSEKIHSHYKFSEKFQLIDQLGIDDNNAGLDIQNHTLEELQERILNSYVVIHLVGNEPGNPVEYNGIQEFLKGTGSWLHKKKSDMCRALETSQDDWDQLTYTQWEAYIALHFKKNFLCYDLREEDIEGSSQQKHLARLYHAGQQYATKCTKEELLPRIRSRLERGFTNIDNNTDDNTPLIIEPNDPCLPACLDIMGAIDFVGRVNDLSSLDKYFAETSENKTKIIQIVAQGGAGKTKLVARWLHSRRIAGLLVEAEEKIPRHSHIDLSPVLLEKSFKSGSVFGYSLYSQGTNELSGSGKTAVETPIWEQSVENWFYDDEDLVTKFKEYGSESPEKKAKLLFDVLVTQSTPTILILDGLEAALVLKQDEERGEPEWTTNDDFLKSFIKLLLKDETGQCILILTTRVKMKNFGYEDRIVTHKLAPLTFKGQKRKNEAASLLYYYYKERSPEAAEILTSHSKGNNKLRGKDAKILREELLRSVEINIPKDAVLVQNLRNIAQNLKGHTLSLKLAGQLIAKGIPKYHWEYFAQNFDPLRHQSELSRFEDDDNFSKTITRVNKLLEPHVKIFLQEKQYAMVQALFAIGVFDRQASFEEIEHAANYLTDLKECPLQPSEPEELKAALNKLSVDGFLIPPEEENGQEEWDCHPLVRAYLSNYIYRMDEQKAKECHHQVANFYLGRVSEIWRGDILNFLEELNKVGRNSCMKASKDKETIAEDEAQEKERADRKSKWDEMNKSNEKKQQALADLSYLQRAVYHFILAGELRNAWHLYWEWMSVRKEYVFSRFFGKFHDDLVTLSYFFESPWTSIKETQEENQKLLSLDIASLFDAAGFRLRSLNRLTEAHQASGGSFLEWHNAGEISHNSLYKKKALRESSYAAGNRAEYSMVQASLSDALIYAELAVRLADESGDSRVRFIHRVELAEILWQRGDTVQAIEYLQWVDNNIHFKKKKRRKWAELYCLYKYRYGKALVHQGEKEDIEKAQKMANKLLKDATKTKWLLNIGLSHLLNGYIKLAEAKPNWIISPQHTLSPSNICAKLNFGIEHFKLAEEQFKKIRAGHHILKAQLGVVFCEYGVKKNVIKASKILSDKEEGITSITGERHLFRVDAEVAKAIIMDDAAKTCCTEQYDKITKKQIDRAKKLCITYGYLRPLPLLDSLFPKEG